VKKPKSYEKSVAAIENIADMLDHFMQSPHDPVRAAPLLGADDVLREALKRITATTDNANALFQTLIQIEKIATPTKESESPELRVLAISALASRQLQDIDGEETEAPADSNLVRHAWRELRSAGFVGDGAGYGDVVGAAVMRAVRSWSRENHSGFSHKTALAIFNKVVNFQPLGPLTDNPAEWGHVGEGTWQSTRQSEAFSNDGGKTYYLLDELHDHYHCQNEECEARGVGWSGKHPAEPDACHACGVMRTCTKQGKLKEDAMHTSVPSDSPSAPTAPASSEVQ